MNKQLTNDCIKLLEANKNLVLTGAPGTGKTFLARQIAAQMVLGKEIENLDSLTPEQKDLLDAHTAFVQFHPSYDYTDFVEGLRPISAENGEIKFERKDGVFKDFCRKAISHFANVSFQSVVKEISQSAEIESSQSSEDESFQSVNDEAIRNIYNRILERIRNGEIIEVKLKGGKTKEIKEITPGNIGWEREDGRKAKPDIVSSKKVLDIFHDYPIRTYFAPLSSTDVKKQYGGDGGMRRAIVNLIWDIIEQEHIDIINSVTKKDIKDTQVSDAPIEGVAPRPCIFIIDEINRGELSKIFGELFFSIDPGYRGDKSIRVQTQYQNLITEKADPFKDGFYVPENVYIIGTMNDIDRSIESMDFAIRRRFAWTEIKADENIDMLDKLGDRKDKAQEVMKALNTEIEMIEGLSSAYHIGASYFLKLDNYKDSQYPYQDLWDYHLKGLLTEYLRGLEDAGTKLDELKNAYDEASKETNSAEG